MIVQSSLGCCGTEPADDCRLLDHFSSIGNGKLYLSNVIQHTKKGKYCKESNKIKSMELSTDGIVDRVSEEDTHIEYGVSNNSQNPEYNFNNIVGGGGKEGYSYFVPVK